MSAQQQNHPSDSGPFMGLRQWRETGVALATLPALTLIVFIRKKLGYRTLSQGRMFILAFTLWLLNGLGNVHMSVPLLGSFGARTQSDSLLFFGLAFLALGLWERRKAWKNLLKGVPLHTRTFGISYLEFLPIRTDLVYRYGDAGGALLAGLVIRKAGFSGLGLWLIISAVCLDVVEEYRSDRQIERDLDTLDGLIESDAAGATVAHFEEQETPRSVEMGAGIATGTDDLLAAVIAKRKREAAGVRS